MRWLVVSLLLCASAALAQASAVKIVDPSDQTKQANVKAVGSERALTVRCVEGCASTINLGDAGISITATSWFPDGGSIGYMRMPDGGALEVYVTGGIAGGGGWTPDGGYIGTVGQGPGADGGAWQVYVINPSGGGSGGAVIQGVAADGGLSWAVNQTHVGSNVIDTGSGATGAGTQRVVLSTDQPAVAVSAAALPLPAGAATAANQTTVGGQTTKLNDGTDTALITGAGALVVDGSGVTQPVSAASLPLPTGAATSALQTTGNTSLSSIDTKTPALGQTTMAGSSPVTIASNQSAVPASQSGTWSTRTQDGAGNALASSTTAPAGSEQALIVRNIPSGTQTVSGSVTASGTVTANQGTPAATANRWPTQITDGTDLAQVSAGGALLVDGSATTQPVSGTVTANAGTGNFAVNQTQVNGVAVSTGNGVAGTGVQRVTIASDNTAFTVNAAQSGTWNIANVSGTVSLPTGAATSALQTTGNTSLSNIDADFPAPAALADATANPTVSGIGSYLMGYNGSTWDRLRNSTANGLLVDVSRIQGTVAVTQSGSWNVGQSGTWNVGLNAGTNYVGRVRQTDGTLDLSLLNSAPGSDTGQVSIPVRVISSLAGGAGGTSSSFTSAFPASGTAAGFSDGTNMQGARVYDTDTGGGSQYTLGVNLRVGASGGSAEAAAGAGTTSAATLRVVLPTDQTTIPVNNTTATNLKVEAVGASADNSTNTATKQPVIPARANASAPSWTEGNQVPLSTDLAGALRVSGTITANAGSGNFSTNLAQYGGTTVGAANALHVQPGTGAQFTVVGTKSQNAATPGSDNLGALVAQVGSSDTSWTDTRMTTLSVDTTGFLRTREGIFVNSLSTMRTAEGYDADTGAGTNFLQGMLLRFSASGGSVEAVAGAGVTTSGTQRVVLPTDQTAIPVTDNGSSLTVDGTVTANAGTGNFTVVQSTASNLRTQTASEGATGSAVPATAAATGWSDGTNLRIPRVTDLDTSGGTIWAPLSTIAGGGFGAPVVANVEGVAPTTAGTGLYVWSISKSVTNPVTSAVTCATTATAAPASVLTYRTTLTVTNNSTATIYLGGSAVTTSTGIPLLPGASFQDNVANSTYYCIVASGTADLRVLEN